MTRYDNLLEELRDLRKGSLSVRKVTVELPSHLAIRTIEECLDREINGIGPTITKLLTEFFRCLDNGIATSLNTDVLKNLNFVCNLLGLNRESLIRMMISESLPLYLEKAEAVIRQRRMKENDIKELVKRNTNSQFQFN